MSTGLNGSRRLRTRVVRNPDALALLALVILGAGLPLAFGIASGSLGIPRNDDWSYRRIALELARSGRFALDGAAETMIIGQIIFAQPFLWVSRLEPWGFATVGVLMAIAAIAAAYFVARRLLPAKEAKIAAGLVAVFPGYLAYATSFMSDVPALAAQMGCLGLGSIAIATRPARTRWLAASLAVGCIAFSVRDFALAAPVAVLVAAFCANPRSRSVWISGVAVAAWCVGLYVWRSSFDGQLGDARAQGSAPFMTFSPAKRRRRHGTVVATIFRLPLLAPPAGTIILCGACRWVSRWIRRDT